MKQYINEARRMQELAGIKSNQTAVQKLEQQLKDVLGDMFIDFALEQEFEQAKEMEKQQIIQAHGSGQILENGSDYIGMNEETNAEIYYDKTYGK